LRVLEKLACGCLGVRWHSTSAALRTYNWAMLTLNERAHELCNVMVADADELGIAVSTLECGTRIIDCGAKAPGSLEAGRRLAEVCLAGRGIVELVSVDPRWGSNQTVSVRTEQPVAACMASQYAGWELKGNKFFAMGSGPMRAAACRETIFRYIANCEKPNRCVGVLETNKRPPEDVCLHIAEKCGISTDRLTLLVARTASPAGTLQIVARSVETALHKLYELGFDLNRVIEGSGSAPLPPVGIDDLQAIGWTNDAILYGAVVRLKLKGDEGSLTSIGPSVPSDRSADYGRPFGEIFQRYNGDFYRIDPMLFSPAVVELESMETGRTFRYGQIAPEILAESFAK
jgi:methenyltetrahydromethanopterin cyclohydrolase